MTRADDSASGRSGNGIGPASEPSGSSADSAAVTPSMFAGLASPLGPLESVERLRILETLSYGILYEGTVFQASRGTPIWLLELDASFQRDPETLSAILVEQLAASRLQNASILPPRGVFRHGESLYVVEDASPGVSLSTAFEFLGRSGLRLSSEAVLRVAGAALDALDHAASSDPGKESPNACHGLLTPENLFVAEGQRVLVRGFGLWPAGIDRLGLLGPGQRRYIAPSQNRTGTASPRTDLLSLGMILFEAVVGVPAFDAPPEEEDLAELRLSIGELQGQADPALWDLFEIVLSCLTPPATVTPVYRSRVRKMIDTLFLREFSRDRSAKTLTLDELVARVKPRRPAIVKATSISLVPEEPVSPEAHEKRSEPATVGTRGVEEEDGIPAPVTDTPAEVAEVASRAPAFATISPASRGWRWKRRRISMTTWTFAGAAIAVILLLALFWSAWPRAEPALTGRRGAASLERPILRPAPSPFPLPPTAIAPTVKPEEPPRAAAPTALVAPERGAGSRSLSSRPRRAGSAKRQARHREVPEQTRKSPAPAPMIGKASPSPSAVSPVAEVAAVAPGTLVPFRTPGLVAPVLLESPPMPRYEDADSRGAVERSALLEILVSDSGRVRGSRILRADRLPEGFFAGLEKYLAAARFQPAQLGGVPVKVWMPYELKYSAP